MNNAEKVLDCYIAGIVNEKIDTYLEARGFARGLIVFAIPAFGTLFRCRAEGEAVDLEFGALFSLLRFLTDKLAAERVKRVRIHSSNPELIFAFGGFGKHIGKGSEREKMLKEFSRVFQITVVYLASPKNRALLSAADYPSIPNDRKLPFRPKTASPEKSKFQPFQKGIKL